MDIDPNIDADQATVLLDQHTANLEKGLEMLQNKTQTDPTARAIGVTPPNDLPPAPSFDQVQPPTLSNPAIDKLIGGGDINITSPASTAEQMNLPEPPTRPVNNWRGIPDANGVIKNPGLADTPEFKAMAPLDQLHGAHEYADRVASYARSQGFDPKLVDEQTQQFLNTEHDKLFPKPGFLQQLWGGTEGAVGSLLEMAGSTASAVGLKASLGEPINKVAQTILQNAEKNRPGETTFLDTPLVKYDDTRSSPLGDLVEGLMPNTGWAEVYRDYEKGIVQTATSYTSPKMLMLWGLLHRAGPAGQRAASAVITASNLDQLPQTFKDFQAAKDVHAQRQIAASTLLNFALPAAGLFIPDGQLPMAKTPAAGFKKFPTSFLEERLAVETNPTFKTTIAQELKNRKEHPELFTELERRFTMPPEPPAERGFILQPQRQLPAPDPQLALKESNIPFVQEIPDQLLKDGLEELKNQKANPALIIRLENEVNRRRDAGIQVINVADQARPTRGIIDQYQQRLTKADTYEKAGFPQSADATRAVARTEAAEKLHQASQPPVEVTPAPQPTTPTAEPAPAAETVKPGRQVHEAALTDPANPDSIIGRGKTHIDAFANALDHGVDIETVQKAMESDNNHEFLDQHGDLIREEGKTPRQAAANVAVAAKQAPEGTTELQSQMLAAGAPENVKSPTAQVELPPKPVQEISPKSAVAEKLLTLAERPVTESEKTNEMFQESNWTHVVDVTDAAGKEVGKIRGNVTDEGFEVKGANVTAKGKGNYQKILTQLAEKYGSVRSDTDMQPAAEGAWKAVGAELQKDGTYLLTSGKGADILPTTPTKTFIDDFHKQVAALDEGKAGVQDFPDPTPADQPTPLSQWWKSFEKRPKASNTAAKLDALKPAPAIRDASAPTKSAGELANDVETDLGKHFNIGKDEGDTIRITDKQGRETVLTRENAMKGDNMLKDGGPYTKMEIGFKERTGKFKPTGEIKNPC
jgi:hypothetical protein